MNKFGIKKTLITILSTIVFSYSIYALIDIYIRKNEKLLNDYCLDNEYSNLFQKYRERKKIGLPDISFSSYNMETKKDNSSRVYTTANKSRLKKITYYCFSNSEEDIYLLDNGMEIKVDYYFENKNSRFSLYKNSDFKDFILAKDAFKILTANGYSNNFTGKLFYSHDKSELTKI